MAFEVGANVGGESDPASAGPHNGVICEVVDLGPSFHEKYGHQHRGVVMVAIEEKTKFELDGKEVEKNKELRWYFDVPRGLGAIKRKDGTKLRKLVEGLRGRKFTFDELLAFVPADKKVDGRPGGGKRLPLDKLVGVPCMAVAEPATSEDGREFAKFVSIAKHDPRLGPPMAVPANYTPLLQRVRQDDSGDGAGSAGTAPGGDDALPWD